MSSIASSQSLQRLQGGMNTLSQHLNLRRDGAISQPILHTTKHCNIRSPHPSTTDTQTRHRQWSTNTKLELDPAAFRTPRFRVCFWFVLCGRRSRALAVHERRAVLLARGSFRPNTGLGFKVLGLALEPRSEHASPGTFRMKLIQTTRGLGSSSQRRRSARSEQPPCLVLLLAHPHLLEGAERCEDGAARAAGSTAASPLPPGETTQYHTQAFSQTDTDEVCLPCVHQVYTGHLVRHTGEVCLACVHRYTMAPE